MIKRKYGVRRVENNNFETACHVSGGYHEAVGRATDLSLEHTGVEFAVVGPLGSDDDNMVASVKDGEITRWR